MDKRLLVLFLFALLLRVAFIPLNAHPLSDSYWHYLHAKDIFENGYVDAVMNNLWNGAEFNQPTDYRPPLYPIVVGLFLLFYESPLTAQLVSAAIGALLVIPTCRLSEKFFGRKAANWSALFVAVNPFLIMMSTEIQPRMMVSVLVLSFIYVSTKRDWAGMGILSALAYLTHYSAAFFIAPVGIHFLVKDWKRAILYTTAFLIICAPWFVRNMVEFNDPAYSSSRYVAIMHNIEQYHAFNPPTTQEYLTHYSVLEAAAIRALNMFTTFIPPPHKALEYGLEWTLSYPQIGLITPCVFLFGVFGMWKFRRTPIPPLTLSATLLASLVFGYPKSNGMSMDGMSPAVPLFTIIAVAWVFTLQKDNIKAKILLFMLTIMVVQGIFLYHTYPREIDENILRWVQENTPENATMMSRDSYFFAYYLEDGRKWITTPYCTEDELHGFIEEQGVDYYLVGESDTKNREWSMEQLMERYDPEFCDREYCALKTINYLY